MGYVLEAGSWRLDHLTVRRTKPMRVDDSVRDLN